MRAPRDERGGEVGRCHAHDDDDEDGQGSSVRRVVGNVGWEALARRPVAGECVVFTETKTVLAWTVVAGKPRVDGLPVASQPYPRRKCPGSTSYTRACPTAHLLSSGVQKIFCPSCSASRTSGLCRPRCPLVRSCRGAYPCLVSFSGRACPREGRRHQRPPRTTPGRRGQIRTRRSTCPLR